MKIDIIEISAVVVATPGPAENEKHNKIILNKLIWLLIWQKTYVKIDNTIHAKKEELHKIWT